MSKVTSIFILFIVLFAGCRSTKFVPESEYLLDKVSVEVDNNAIKDSDIKPYIKQKSNARILGVVKLNLILYNLSSKNKNGFISRLLRKIGEPPVVYDEKTIVQSETEIKRFMFNKGFANAEIETNIEKKEKRRKINLIYAVTSNTPYLIAESKNDIQDTTIANFIELDSAKMLRIEGNRFDLDVLDDERERVSELLKNNGYYNFSKDNLSYVVDTTLGNYRVKDIMVLEVDTANPERSYEQYSIRNVQFIVGYDAQKALEESDSYLAQMDSVWYQGVLFLSEGHTRIKPEIISRNNLLRPGMTYSKRLSDRTHSLLSSIAIIKYVNVNFIELPNNQLDCSIFISLAKPQTFSADIEGANVSGNFGGAISIGYAHKNLFRGAEQFTTNFTVGKEAIVKIGSNEVSSADELGADFKLTYPKFVFPFLKEDFKQKSRAKTSFGISLDYQKRPEFTRNIAAADIAYSWRTSKKVRHQLTPLMFNYISIPKMTNAFAALVDTTEYLKYSFQDHVIFGSKYGVTLQDNYTTDAASLSRYLWLSFENSGNAIYAFNNIFNSTKREGGRKLSQDEADQAEDAYYRFLNVRYSQYFKFDAIGIISHYINKSNTMAYRLQFGIGVPYGNSKQLPFEKRYFGGGANGVRAWPVRSLGPGCYFNEDVDYYNQSGDINFVASAEYRFKMFWRLEGGLFADVGNTWTIREYEEQPDAAFKFDSFYKQLASGIGAGLRLDLNFFVFRLDFAWKVYDPTEDMGDRWVFGTQWKPTTHIAIGYPF